LFSPEFSVARRAVVKGIRNFAANAQPEGSHKLKKNITELTRPRIALLFFGPAKCTMKTGILTNHEI